MLTRLLGLLFAGILLVSVQPAHAVDWIFDHHHGHHYSGLYGGYLTSPYGYAPYSYGYAVPRSAYGAYGSDSYYDGYYPRRSRRARRRAAATAIGGGIFGGGGGGGVAQRPPWSPRSSRPSRPSLNAQELTTHVYPSGLHLQSPAVR